jgi:hypothetical protein
MPEAIGRKLIAAQDGASFAAADAGVVGKTSAAVAASAAIMRAVERTGGAMWRDVAMVISSKWVVDESMRKPTLPIAAGSMEQVAAVPFCWSKANEGGLVRDQGGASDWSDLSPTILCGFHEGLDIGLDRRGPVHWELQKKYGVFPYGGTIHDLVIESGPFAPDSAFGKG